MKKLVISVLLMLALALSLCACGKTEIRPAPDAGAPERALSFETTDLAGNAVSSADLFAAHDYTLVNIWASWCGPCVGELPELQKIAAEYAEKNCAVVGILIDSTDPGGVESAQELLSQAGADYPVLCVPENFDSQMSVQAVPTSVIVDSEGKIVSEEIVGADPDGYRAAFDALLNH